MLMLSARTPEGPPLLQENSSVGKTKRHGRTSGTRTVESILLVAFGIEPITFLHVEP